MVWGYRVRGAHGAAQIDNVRPNFALRDKGSVTLTTDAVWGVSPVVSAVITVTANNPVLAVKCADPVSVQYATNSGTTWTFYVTAHRSSSVTVDWYLFDNAEHVSATVPTWGFRIRKQGDPTKTVLHSGQKVAKFVDVITATGAYTYTSGRTYAVGMAKIRNTFVSNPFTPPGTYRNFHIITEAKVASNVVTVSAETYETTITPFQEDSWGSSSLALLVFDVTGY